MRHHDSVSQHSAQSAVKRDAMIHRHQARACPIRTGEVVSIARMEYEAARRLQWRLRDERIAERRPDTLIILEHEPVMTLGRTTKPAHWHGQTDTFARRGIPVRQCERGGSVTYHGPGQVVGYPVLRLRNFCSGPKMYVHLLEEVVIRVLAEWGITGCRVDTLPGVWVRDPTHADGALAKIAAMGVNITRGVTTHGFALNVTVNLEPFHDILPCGIEGCRVTSMTAILDGACEPGAVREQIARHFGDVFGLRWRESPGSPLSVTGERCHTPQPPLT